MKYQAWTLGALIILFSFCLANRSDASDFHIIDLQELSIDYKNYAALNPNARNMLIYPEHPKEGVNLDLKTHILEYGYWNSTVESLTTSAKYQSIGLETRIGVYLTDHLDLGLYHHSQHELDRSHSYMDKFPSEDAVEVRIYLFRAVPGNGIL